jgi:type IV pilus assembly protein PilM
MLAPHRILAVDIGAASVKVGEFQLAGGHGLRLVNFNYADLGVDPEHEENRKALIVTTLRNVLREKNIRANRVAFSVSGQSVFTRFVKLPPVDESKVVQIIQYEAQQNVPFPIEEVIWDYQLLGSTDKGELEVVLLAIKSDIIEDLNQGVESVGLQTEMVDVAPMALYNAVRYNEGDAEGCTMVVDIGARTTNLLFVEKNKLFTRSIPIAGNAITQSIAAELGLSFRDAEALKKSKGFVALGGAYEEPEDPQTAQISKIIRNVVTRLHAEIGRSINFYRTQQGGSAPARLLLSGGSAIIPYTDRFFKEKLQIPVQYFNPFRNIEIDPRISRDKLGKCAHFLGEIVGLGLRRLSECPLEVNLLPKTIQARKRLRQKRPYLAGAALALLLIPLCLWLFTRKTTELRQEQLRQVRGEVIRLEAKDRELKNEQKLLAERKARADQLTALLSTHAWWPDFLQDIHGCLVAPDQTNTTVWIMALVPETGQGATPPPPTKPRRTSRGGAAPEPETEPPPSVEGKSVITGFRITAAAKHCENDLKLADDFKDRLSKSRFFDPDSVEMVEVPPVVKEGVFTFVLRARLHRGLVF